MGKCGCSFSPRDNSLISRGKSHISRVRGLVVRCLLFNLEVSCSNRWVCAYFFTSIPNQKVLTFFGSMKLFGYVLFAIFKMSPKSPSFNFLIFCNRANVKNPKGSLFQNFRHYETVQNSHFLFFRKFFKDSLFCFFLPKIFNVYKGSTFLFL